MNNSRLRRDITLDVTVAAIFVGSRHHPPSHLGGSILRRIDRADWFQLLPQPEKLMILMWNSKGDLIQVLA